MNIKILGTGCAKCHALERPEFMYKPNLKKVRLQYPG
jgi:hypothetical protein